MFFVFPIAHALTVAMSIGHATIIPGDVNSSSLVHNLPPQQSYQLPQGKASQSQGCPYNENHIQQEVLVKRHSIHGRAQVVGTIVTEDVADPVGRPVNRVARLVFVNVGQKLCLLAVPR